MSRSTYKPCNGLYFVRVSKGKEGGQRTLVEISVSSYRVEKVGVTKFTLTVILTYFRVSSGPLTVRVDVTREM